MMFKTIIMALALFGMVGAANAGDAKLQDVLAASPQINKNCSSTVVKSKRDQKSGDVQTVLITAKHCVVDNQQSEQVVEFPVYKGTHLIGKKEYFATVKGVSYKSDLALLELKDKDTLFEKVVTVGPKEVSLQIGDPVVTIGYPLGWDLTVTKGAFGASTVTDWPKGGTEYFRSTPTIAPGNSGGGLYSVSANGDYELIGVTTGVVPQFFFIGLYTPSYEIRDYLSSALPDDFPKENVDETVKVGK